MKIAHINAFTKEDFKGNPAAVCLLETEKSDPWMQNIAAEFNLSETAFIKLHGEKFSLRWFTPKTEVKLCGHATLASAYFLWENNLVDENSIIFNTKSGDLLIEKKDDLILMHFPKYQITSFSDQSVKKQLEEALQIHNFELYLTENKLLLHVGSEEEVSNCEPDFQKIKKINFQGIILTTKSTNYDFISRYFAPNIGINEDPVTGSNHCALTPFWSQRLQKKNLRAFQASKRGGEVFCELTESGVLIGGHAKTLYRGHLNL